MRYVIAALALVLAGCDRGSTEPDLVPEYKLRHLAGTWEGDSDCAGGRYRITFHAPPAGFTYATGSATLFTENAAGQCVETRTDHVTANVGVAGAVTVYWTHVGPPVNDRVVYRSTFRSMKRFEPGAMTLEQRPNEILPPGRFAMVKR